ncbi:Rrf2 family transcriptional regulator [Paenibacillus flagellatus]|uniref:Transcriptional regulator n=1 Tax=Paenibacillus flagellatus TaxID=2211139 RepID=A0A2V5JWM6_9BACL|nr:Rrf2 family transcriptional regulator [Paenibacillus flagellatus]PYI51001.1 transcriptional regulator [Paenibacillus flagellatus]
MSLEKPAGIFSYKMFGLSLQALVVLTKQKDTCPSWDIAQHLRSEATQLRRVLAKLVRENILETKEGRDGGYRLKKPANTVTLAEVYTALRMEEPICGGLMDTAGDHPLGDKMNAVFADLTTEIDRSVLDVLSRYTIADLADRVHGTK